MAYLGLDQSEIARQLLQQALLPSMNYRRPALLTWLLPQAAVLLAQAGQQVKAVELVTLLENYRDSPKGYHKPWEPYANLSRAQGSSSRDDSLAPSHIRSLLQDVLPRLSIG